MAEILNGSNSAAAIEKLSTGVSMPNADQPPVGDQSAGDTVKNGENIDLKIATAMQLGKVSNDLVDLEGGIQTNIVLTEMDKTNKNNIINEAVEQKMASYSGLGRIARGIPIIKQVVMAGLRAKAAGAVSKSGDSSRAFTKLGLEAKSLTGTDNAEYVQRSARLALEESGFADKVDSTNSIALNAGEKVEKVQDPITSQVKDELMKLYSAGMSGDAAKAKEAREAYNEKIEQWQNEGLFGDNQANAGRKILENSVVRFLIGDHSEKSITELEGLKKAADGVEDLAKHKIGSDTDLKKYLDNNLSLYSASMKEGLHTKQKLDTVLAATAAGGVFGGVTAYLLTTATRSSVKSQVAGEVAKRAVSNAAIGAVSGLFGGLVGGLVRGVGHATETISKSEIADATSGEAIVTAAERAELAKAAAKEAASKAAEDADTSKGDEGTADAEKPTEENAEESAENANATKKAKIGAIYEKVIKIKKRVTGEDKYLNKANELRDRRSAKDIYDTLDGDALLLDIANASGKEEFNKKFGSLDTETKELIISSITRCSENVDEALRNNIDEALGRKKGQSQDKEKIFEILTTDAFKDAIKKDLKDTIIDVRARENLTTRDGGRLRMKIDLIKYSEGNVDKERSLIREKLVEANKLLGDDAIEASGDSAVDKRMAELRTAQEKAGSQQGNYMINQVLADMVLGATIGASAGFILGHMKDVKLAKEAAATSSGAGAAEGANAVEGTPGETTDAAGVGETVPKGEPQLVDDDGNGIYELKIGNETVVSEGDGGITFDAETGKMSNESMDFLKSKGLEINETAETHMAQGARTTEGIYDYFKSSNAEAYGEGIETGNKIANIDIKGYVAAEGANRAVNVVPAGIENDGDLVFQVNTLPNAGDIDVDKLQVVLTPSKDLGDVGIVLDVAPDGTVVVPADSVAASMFTQGNFSGGAMRVVQEVAGGEGGYNVLATASGSGTLESIGFTNPAEITTFSYTLNGAPFNVPSGVQAEAALATVGAESIRNSDPVEYTYQSIDTVPTDNIQGPVDFSPENGRNYISVNGAAENGNFELIQMPHREGNYNEMLDPFLSDNKDGANLLGQNLVRQMVDPDYEMTPEQADAAFIEALDSGRMSTNQVLHHILEAKGNSPEGIVSLRAKMGDFMYDIDGDGTEELIDTQEEINAVADMLKDSAEPEGYSAFVNDTYERFFEKMNGGEVRVVNYAENPYTYSEHGFIDKMNNIIRAFAVKKTTPTGIGLEFVDKDGNSIYDEDAIRSIYRIPAGQQISMISDRLECGDDTQTTVRTIFSTINKKVEGDIESQVQPQGGSTPTTTPTTPGTPGTPPDNPETPEIPENPIRPGKGANTHAGNEYYMGDTAPVTAENRIVFNENPGSELDRTPGSEIVGENANIATEGAVTDASGNAMTDAAGNTYIANGTEANVNANIAENVQTTFSGSTEGRVEGAASDVAAAMGGNTDNAAAEAARQAAENAARAADQAAAATSGAGVQPEVSQAQAAAIYSNIASNPGNEVAQ